MTSQYIITHLNLPRSWYVVLTSVYAEQQVSRELERDGFITYLPLTSVRRKWGGHTKEIHIPLLRRCVFVYATNAEARKIEERYPIFEIAFITQLTDIGNQPG